MRDTRRRSVIAPSKRLTGLYALNTAYYTAGNIKHQVLVSIASGGASLFAFFFLDIISVVYIGLLHDEQAMAAYGVAKAFLFLVSTLQTAFVVSCAALLSKLIGEGSQRQIAAFIQCLLALSFSGVAMVVVAELLAFGPVARWLGIEGRVADLCHSYVMIVSPAAILMTIVHMATQVLRTAGKATLAMYITLATSIVFTVTAPLLMFGLDLGIIGNALAYAFTALVCVAVSLIGLGVTVELRTRRFLWSSIRVHSCALIRMVLPAWLGNLATFVSVTFLLQTLVPFGTAALAAMTVLDRVIQASYCFFFAIPNALSPILGQNIGANKPERVFEAIGYSQQLVLRYGVAIWLGSLGLAYQFAEFAGLSQMGRSMVGQVLLFAGALWILIGRELIAVAVFVSFRHAWYVPIFAWLRATIGTFPFVWAGAHLYGSSGAFIGMLVGNAGTAVLASFVSLKLSAKWRAGNG